MQCVHIMAFAALSAVAFSGPSRAQEPPPGTYIIFDGSGSMWGKLVDESYKIHAARIVLDDFVSRDFAGRELALRVYGHRREADCSDTQLVVPFSSPSTAADRMRAFLQSINPLGRTPITQSLMAALSDFGDRRGEIILISDGIETCNADPCALMRDWREKDVAVQVHVVGFGVEEREKEALQCIADAAGTEYRDAESAQALADGLASIYDVTTAAALVLRGVDSDGNHLRVHGELTGGREPIELVSERRHLVDPGDYQLVAGVQTRNGTLYRPVEENTTVSATGETIVEVEVPVPPRVYATFADARGTQSGSLVSVLQNGAEVFRFRARDTVFIDPGTYEFQASPNAENRLSVNATVDHGDTKEIAFVMTRTVRARFRMEASGSGIHFRQNYELWQDGEMKYRVHVSNGALVLPGTYDLRLPDRLTPYVVSGIEVTDEDDQEFTLTVPVGHVTFQYLKLDGTPDTDDRVFLSRTGGQERLYKRSGVKHPLTPGSYTVNGWTAKGEYDPVTFQVAVGEDKPVVLRRK